jgi:Predicted NADH:ubiquinone oxidoreductase, subunit RnfC
MRKPLKKIQKDSLKRYCKGKSISTKIGKLVKLVPSEVTEDATKNISSGVNLDKILELLESSNLSGMSGNGYPVKAKLESLLNHPSKKYFIINGVECELGLIHDEWLLDNYWNEVLKGIQIICQAMPFERCVLACKSTRGNKRKKIDAEGIDFCIVPAKYPMGEEHLLIQHVLGKTLDKNEPPVNEGILVMNVQTVYQIYCLLTNQYRNGRYITLADLQSGDARVEYVKRGENIKEKLMECFPRRTEEDYFAGFGIMSSHVIEEDEIFSDEITFAAVGRAADISNNAACKGCGRCNRKCPKGVNIKNIVKRREQDPKVDISDLRVEHCIHCGSCTFFCRAGKNIAEYFESK